MRHAQAATNNSDEVEKDHLLCIPLAQHKKEENGSALAGTLHSTSEDEEEHRQQAGNLRGGMVQHRGTIPRPPDSDDTRNGDVPSDTPLGSTRLRNKTERRRESPGLLQIPGSLGTFFRSLFGISRG